MFRKRGRRGGRRRGKGARLDAKINAKSRDLATARDDGGEVVRRDGTRATVEGLTLDLDGGKNRRGLWEEKRELKAGGPE
jgi:hypothetical protein